MDYLYSAGRKPVDPRYCRTHAYVAQLFADSPASHFNAAAWSYVAQAWKELANLKEVMAEQKIPQMPIDGLDGGAVPGSPEERLSP